jgi:hypothetical protein
MNIESSKLSRKFQIPNNRQQIRSKKQEDQAQDSRTLESYLSSHEA